MQKLEKYLQISEMENKTQLQLGKKVLKLTAGDKKLKKLRNNQIQDLKKVTFRNWKFIKKISENKQEIWEKLKVFRNTE